MNVVSEEREEVNCFTSERDEKAGAMPDEYVWPRGGVAEIRVATANGLSVTVNLFPSVLVREPEFLRDGA